MESYRSDLEKMLDDRARTYAMAEADRAIADLKAGRLPSVSG